MVAQPIQGVNVKVTFVAALFGKIHSIHRQDQIVVVFVSKLWPDRGKKRLKQKENVL